METHHSHVKKNPTYDEPGGNLSQILSLMAEKISSATIALVIRNIARASMINVMPDMCVM
jgi:hypothetical protein